MPRVVSRQTKTQDADVVEAKPKSKAKTGKSNGRKVEKVEAEPKGKAAKTTKEVSEAKLNELAERAEEEFVPDTETANAPISPRTIHTRASKEVSKRQITALAKKEANETDEVEATVEVKKATSSVRRLFESKKCRAAASHTAVSVITAVAMHALQYLFKTCVC